MYALRTYFYIRTDWELSIIRHHWTNTNYINRIYCPNRGEITVKQAFKVSNNINNTNHCMHSLTLYDVCSRDLGVRVWKKIDGMKSNDGASLFIYMGSGCPGTKNCISNWGKTTKTLGGAITSSTIYKLYVNVKFNLVLHSLLQRHLRNSYKNFLSNYWK